MFTSEPRRTLAKFEGLTLIVNDGSITKELVTFVGVEFVNNREQHFKTQRKYESLALVCPELPHFVENPDIALISYIPGNYCRECLSVDPTQIKNILNPKPLSPLQKELMQHHVCLRHLPFPKLILLAEKGEIPRRLALLKKERLQCV